MDRQDTSTATPSVDDNQQNPAGWNVWTRLSPLVIAGAYALIGLLWIVFSDLLVASISVGGLDVSLSLVKGIGFVLVTGTLLFLVLRRREAWLSAARHELTRWVADDDASDLDHLRVLLVDDDREDRRLICEAIMGTVEFTLDVDEVANIVEARQRILERRHDVILVDHRLGGASGLDLIRDLHEIASGPMIVVTGSADPEIDRAAQRAGAHDYLLKHEIQASWIGRTLRYAVANWQAQKEIARTRQLYAEIVQETPVGLFRTTPVGGLTEANPALLAIFGANSIEELQKLGIATLYRNPETRSGLLERIAAGETIEDENIEMQRVDGTPIHVRMRMRGIADDDGLVALYGAIADVTTQLDNERRIRSQASMLDQVRNAVVRTDMRGVVTYWNRAAETVFGWTPSEALGRSVLDLTPAPSELARSAEIMRQMARTGQWEGEFLCRRKDGSEFPAYVSNSVLTAPDGTASGFVGITVDLSELRGAQERAAAQEAMAASVLETVHFPVCVLDDAGTIMAVNGAWTDNAIAQHADLEAVGVGVNYLAVCDRADMPDAVEVGAGIRTVLTDLEQRFSYEYPCGPYWFRLEVAQAVKPLGGAIAMHIDITDLREAARQAEEFARSKDRLIASVSHELRTPLTAVLGFADLIEQPDGLDHAELTQFASEIHRQATDMASIVEDLLVAARAEMGALTVRLEPVDAIRQLQDVIAHIGNHPSIEIEHILPPDVPTVWADPLRLRQVLRNLVNNALRYGGSRVRVDAMLADNRVALRVSDDGEGVPEHLSEAIFQPFFSAHDRIGQPDSLGLGLSVVKTLTEAMGGTIALSTDDGWTVFTISLPRADID